MQRQWTAAGMCGNAVTSAPASMHAPCFEDVRVHNKRSAASTVLAGSRQYWSYPQLAACLSSSKRWSAASHAR
jgi:hypothetical protein